jgi:hypothetical protein
MKPHTHPCQQCGNKTTCDGECERNHDGSPEVICRSFHLPGGVENPNFICERCWDQKEMSA